MLLAEHLEMVLRTSICVPHSVYPVYHCHGKPLIDFTTIVNTTQSIIYCPYPYRYYKLTMCLPIAKLTLFPAASRALYKASPSGDKNVPHSSARSSIVYTDDLHFLLVLWNSDKDERDELERQSYTPGG
ncbi:hypothetical protein AFLA_004409 [Aspergillus flavus NRRL3357]|nr:hypothetical protein AFLA_004409 [Aspergillus flavus NRRL3357]